VNVALKRFLIDDPLLFSTRSCRTYYDALIRLNKNEAHNLVYSQPAGKPASLHAIYFPQSARLPDCRPLQVPEQGFYFSLFFLYFSCTMHGNATAKWQNKDVFFSIFSIPHAQCVTLRLPSARAKLYFSLFSLFFMYNTWQCEKCQYKAPFLSIFSLFLMQNA